MRLPFPTRIPLQGACVFGLLLMAVQLFQGTSPLFAVIAFLFIIVATVTFNLAGGFSRTSGSYIFFYSMLAVILGLCTKALVGEAGDSNLLVPQRTMLVFLTGICAMYGATFLSLKAQPAKGLLQDFVNDRNLQNAAVGSMVAGYLIHTAEMFFARTSGSVIGVLAQIDNFQQLAILFGTIYEIRRSGGRRSVNLTVLLAGADLFLTGLAGFSKQGMFTPFLCWLAAAASQRYKLSLKQVAGILLGSAFIIYYLVPYAQYGRGYQDDAHPTMSHMDTIVFLLSNLDYVREQYDASFKDQVEERQNGDYFKVNVGLFDRLQMIAPDDKLINATEIHGKFGMLPIYMSFANLVPHFIWADKPVPIAGNYYAHQIGGIIADDDGSTGISFSPTGEAYHLERWLGVLVLAPVIWFLYFTLFDSLCGDTRIAPWGLLMIVYNGHIAPEGMLNMAIYGLGFISAGVVFVAFCAAYFLPILATLIKGPERTTLRRISASRSIPGRSRTLPASSN